MGFSNVLQAPKARTNLEHALHLDLPGAVIDHRRRARLRGFIDHCRGEQWRRRGASRRRLVLRCHRARRRGRPVARGRAPARNAVRALWAPRELGGQRRAQATAVVRGQVGRRRVHEALRVQLHLNCVERVPDELLPRHARGELSDVQVRVEEEHRVGHRMDHACDNVERAATSQTAVTYLRCRTSFPGCTLATGG
jgi:hypothetical protein